VDHLPVGFVVGHGRVVAQEGRVDDDPSMQHMIVNYLERRKMLERSAKAQTSPPGLNARVSCVVARFWAKIRRERRATPTIAKLEAFDDRTPKDIGIHRC
jgi:hypothetical protein